MKRKDLTDTKINEFTVLRYIGDNKWECKCSCGRIKNVRQYELVNGIVKSCGHLNRLANDLIGNTFDDIKVIESAGRGQYKCVCKCGAEKEMVGNDIRKGKGTKCNHFEGEELDKLIGKRQGKLEVKGRKGALLICKCDCGEEKDINRSLFEKGNIKSCGCLNYDKINALIGAKFGELKVVEYTGNSMYKCLCSCGNYVEVSRSNLRAGTSSCGCKKSMLMRIAKDKLYNKERTVEQLEALNTKESFEEYIKNNFENKPTIHELSVGLSLSESNIRYYVDKFDSHKCITGAEFYSKQERELFDTVKSYLGPNDIILQHDKITLSGKELDIYIPTRHLAIEFNGSYWHSDLHKSEKYHQNKTILCTKKGIRLIHIFEYEWYTQQEKILGYLKDILVPCKVIYGRNTSICEIESNESNEFMNNYHLQNIANASVKLGLFFKSELVGVMSFSKPRYNSNYEWEIVRLAFKSGIRVTGGIEKMFKYFINKYNPNSIVSYCDISKFTGNSYLKLGFTTSLREITKPNYKWVEKSIVCPNVLTRYQTMKHILVEKGLDIYGNTEDEIMRNLHYFKVYDCGNLRLSWYKEGRQTNDN